MFSEKLQKLIDASLVDGVITDKERAVIHKCALQEGVDPDEIDLLLDAELQKLTSSKNSQKHGVIRKCPSCGAIYEAGSVKCPQCGYVFVGINANSSSKLLFDKLNEIDSLYRGKGDGNYLSVTFGFSKSKSAKLDEERGNIIRNFPIPTTKDDLLEFIPIMEERWKGTVVKSDESGRSLLDKEKMAYRSKYLECIQKAEMMFGNDKDFAYLFERYRKKNMFIDGILNKLRMSKAATMGFISLFFMVAIIMGGVWAANHESKQRKELKEQINSQYVCLSNQIDSLDSPNLSDYDQCKRKVIALTWSEISLKEAFREEKEYQKQLKEQFEEKKRTYILLLNSFYKKRYKKDDDDLKEFIDKETN